MAAARRSTLPKDFDDLLTQGDDDAVRAVFDACRVDARGGYRKQTALAFAACPATVARWLVDHGADVEARDAFSATPLHSHARAWNGQPGMVLDLGADIEAEDREGATPLHGAADRHHVRHVRVLLERGANVEARDRHGRTPAATALDSCENATIAPTVEILEALIGAGAVLPDDLQARAARIGASFEFHRQGFNAEALPTTDAALQRLYALAGAEPVAARRMHDGSSRITVTAPTWQGRRRELWELLVPSRGPAATVQGEVIRVTGRIADEIERNGGANWDRDYQSMADALPGYFALASALTAPDLAAVTAEVHRLRGRDRLSVDHAALSERAVRWVEQNPEPIRLDSPTYRR